MRTLDEKILNHDAGLRKIGDMFIVRVFPLVPGRSLCSGNDWSQVGQESKSH
jgi:hypothetical protein